MIIEIGATLTFCAEHHVAMPLQDLNALRQGRLEFVRRHIFNSRIKVSFHQFLQAGLRPSPRAFLEPIRKEKCAAQDFFKGKLTLLWEMLRPSLNFSATISSWTPLASARRAPAPT